MGANDKLDATFHPQPGRSGAAAVLRATEAADAFAKHADNLQRAVDDVRTWCHGKKTVPTVEVTNILKSHHV